MRTAEQIVRQWADIRHRMREHVLARLVPAPVPFESMPEEYKLGWTLLCDEERALQVEAVAWAAAEEDAV
jgi:hypothetical protein